MSTGTLHQGKLYQLNVDINGKTFEIQIKVGMIGNEIISVKPEYEDARRISEESSMSLKNVMDLANQVFMEKHDYQC